MKVKKQRYPFLDGIRGMMLISMILYHGAWNLVYIHGIKWDWYHSTGAYIWQQSICWTFILLSGFCWSLGRRHLKSGLLVFGGGLLVTAVTLLVMPSNRVICGVLTCIGSCILLMILLDRFLKKVSPLPGAVGSFVLFLVTKRINKGYLGFGEWKLAALPESWYQGNIAAYLGFTPTDFYSTDYFSLIPWIFLFITGYFLFHICKRKNILECAFLQWKIPVCGFLGQHSLLIYLLHQPVLFLFGSIILG